MTNQASGVPEEYRGREQSYVKHRVLNQYIQSWAQKLASAARYFGGARIWYVDCFSGPWESACQRHEDTSIHIGLNAIQEAAAFWATKGFRIRLGAIFVEKDPAAYQKLKTYLEARRDQYPVDIHPLYGEFGSKVAEIESLVGNDPAFLFVDPTGWKGAAMKFIAPLAKRERRDVMVNVMYDHLNRFRGAKLDYVRLQLAEFFETEVPADLPEEELFSLYRAQLKKICGLRFAADLVVEDPLRDRTKFRLVLGAHHPTALTLFREVERKVLGEEAPLIRSIAKEAKRFERTGQYVLLGPEPPDEDLYRTLRNEALELIEARLREILCVQGSLSFRALADELLQDLHLTEADLGAFLGSWRSAGNLLVEGMAPRERTLKDHHIIRSFIEYRSVVEAIPVQESLF